MALPSGAAVTIVSTTTHGNDGYLYVTGAAAWSQTGTYTNVSIVIAADPGGDGIHNHTASGTAYLTTQVGAGTTVANEVARASYSVTGVAFSPGLVTLFTGLTLGPGTYYLVVDPQNGGGWEVWDFGITPTTAPGVAVLGELDFYPNPTASYPPASPFGSPTLSTNLPELSVTGDVANPPVITSLSPAAAAAGSAGFTLTVDGLGFAAGAVAQWNGTPLSTTFVSSTQVTAAVTANLLASTGTATITVISGVVTTPGVSFTVNAPGACTFNLNQPAASFGAAGGSGSVSVTGSTSDCTGTATTSAPWIGFVGNPTITGSGVLSYTVGQNNAATSRTGTITIGTQVFTVTQGGTTCTYSLPGASQTFGPVAGSGTAAVQATSGCNWTASSGVPWVTITSSTGSGDGAVSYSVTANNSTAARSGTLSIANLPYTVSQAGSGNTASCTASVPSVPQVAIEGRTETLGDYLLTCSGLTGTLKTDISLALSTNVTNALTGGLTDAILTVNGNGSQNGQVAGYNSLRWPGVSIVPAANGNASVRISKVRADASLLGTADNLQSASITGQVEVSGVPVNGALETMASASASLAFTKSQANPPTGGAQTSIPLLFQEAYAAAFQAALGNTNATRLRMVLSNVPATVQVYAPVYPVEGATRAQLYSADANGAGGSPVAGSPFAG